MSGWDSWAIVVPSNSSTIEWTIDCGWTTTSIRSYATPNSSWASITSSPLFISVDESIVILRPIRQVGWASASSTPTTRSSSRDRPRNGPPDAVTNSRRTPSPFGSALFGLALFDPTLPALDPGRPTLVATRHW